MKRTMNRLLARLAMLCVAIILGAIAVAQAQRGMQQQMAGVETSTAPSQVAGATQPLPSFQQPIPNDQPAFQPSTASSGMRNLDVPPQTASTLPPPLPEPDFGPPPPAAAGEFQPSPRVVKVPDSAPPADEGGYYEPNFNDAGGDSFQPNYEPQGSGAFPANQVIPVANDEPVGEPDFPPPANSEFQLEPAAPLPPINQLPLGEPQPAPANEFPAMSQPPTDPAPEPYVVEARQTVQPNYEDYEGRAGIAIREQSPAQMQPISSLPTSPPEFRQGFGNEYGREPQNEFANATPSNDSTRGMGRPGTMEQDGVQTPSLTIAKSAPQETQVGKPARFEVVVRNVGNIPANDVIVSDEIPQGTTLVQTEPPASQAPNGSVVWQLGTIEPGREARVTMEVMPQEEGEIGSVARISFQTSASARTRSTRPQLVIEHDGQPTVLVGDDVIFNIKITNPGTGVAYNVRLEEDVPDGLRHFDGRELEYKVGDLKPGETRLLELKLKADKPGIVNNLLYARADAGLEVADDFQFEVVAPGLQVGVKGPTRRYLERRAAFEIAVANPGTAAARDVSVVARLPRGLKFVDTNNAGRYDSATHTVRWSLAELPAKEMGTVELATMPLTMGEQRIRVETSASMGLQASAEHDVVVDGLAALLFTVTDVSDPIEIGGQTMYEVHVVNQGTKPASNLRLGATIPPGMEAVNGEGPSRAVIEGNRIVFEPLATLAPQADTFYKIHVRGTTAGDKRVVVRLMSDDVAEPVTKEESTHVYSDQ